MSPIVNEHPGGRTGRLRFGWLAAYAVAMAFLESAVVVYLRERWYPQGFTLPLAEIESGALRTEGLREAATLVMLVAVSALASTVPWLRFAAFLFCFGLWDIFYYVFLKALTGWPASLLDWDILFLIPVPWSGPVLAPCLLSLLMTGWAVWIDKALARHRAFTPRPAGWLLLAGGIAMVVFAFCMDYLHALHAGRSEAGYVPDRFAWPVFAGGLALLVAGIAYGFRLPSKTAH